ncbi:MAG: hypothetical protein COC19_01945 [SAR86 cluster bacterium]|uniref:Polyketide cyclase n=1 Tax=SAR86 cluster bacterium TaxID=2030880 RepID=A0A2A4MRV8_9GAMM|nr:MAG: hypothetical protein COC19_01945 [SAR86 cluster bacterium]
MISGFTLQHSIDSPMSSLWDYLVDFDHGHNWMPHVISLKRQDHGDLGRGSRLQATSTTGKLQDWRISYLDSGRSICLISKHLWADTAYTYSLSNTQSSQPLNQPQTSEIQLRLDCRTKGIVNLLRPFILWSLRRICQAQLANIQQHFQTFHKET